MVPAMLVQKRLVWVLGLFALLSAAVMPEVWAQSRSLPRASQKIALIYSGPGSCADEESDCTQSAALVAKLAGLTPKIVPHDIIKEDSKPSDVARVFLGARVWIQPGGVSNEAFNAMDEKLIQGIRDFVKLGGGYVGFCAGAFMATEWIGHTGGEGFGFVNGMTNLYHKGWDMAEVKWLGQDRVIWFEGGPYFYGYDDTVEVTATYATGAAAAVRTEYGKGRVWVTGLHPEAPLNWSTDDGVVDPDGTEQHLAAQMVRWAARLPEKKINPSSVKKAASRLSRFLAPVRQ
jgi:glutamine amidotransferase-like uncharacterized protein